MTHHNAIPPNSRVHGFSLRDSLIHQAPHMNESDIRRHMEFVAGTIKVVPVDLTRYRLDPERPGVIDNG